MSFDIGSVIAYFKADVTNFQRGIKQVNTSVSEVEEKSGSLAGTLVKVGGIGAVAFGAVASAASFLVGAGIRSAKEIEQTRLAFDSLAGSQEKSKKLMEELTEFSKRTPFEFPELATSTKRLLAMGSTTENVLKHMQMLGDVGSLLGKDKLPNLITAFGQIQTKGKLAGQELLQLREAGFNLAEAMGISNEELEKMVSSGLVKFSDVEAAFARATGEGGKFFNGMATQATSLDGIMSNIKDSVGLFIRSLVGMDAQGNIKDGSIFAMARDAAKELQQFMTDNAPQIEAMATNVANVVGTVVTSVVGFVRSELMPIFNELAAFIKAHSSEISIVINSAWNFIVGIIRIAWALVSGIIKVGLAVLRGDWDAAWGYVKESTVKIWEGIKQTLYGAVSMIKLWGDDIYNALTQPFINAWNKVKETVENIKNKLDFTKRNSPSIMDIINKSVRLANGAMEGLNINTGEAQGFRANAYMGAGAIAGGAGVGGITINLDGALIGDQFGAQSIAEKIGDTIIGRLRENVRF